MEFGLKKISFFGRECPIICQNENGPCPLLAIANVLLLQNKISISTDVSFISLAELTQIVANAILEKIGSSTLPDHVKLVESVLNILPKLANGLDLNVIFSGVNNFEFTEEISVFDAMNIQLLHGWVYDASDTVTASVVGNQSYNHLIFRLVEYKSLSSKGDTTAGEETKIETAGIEEGAGQGKDVKLLCYEGGVIEAFLNKTAQQFTYAGMLALYNTLHDRQFAVFFRNNHFSTLFFYNGQLFSLITDLGYREETAVVWEILNDVDGNSEFHDSEFVPTKVWSASTSPARADIAAGVQQVGTIAAPPAGPKYSSQGTIVLPPAVPSAAPAESATVSAPKHNEAADLTTTSDAGDSAAVVVADEAVTSVGAHTVLTALSGEDEAYELVSRDIPLTETASDEKVLAPVSAEATEHTATASMEGALAVEPADGPSTAAGALPMEAADPADVLTVEATVTEPMEPTLAGSLQDASVPAVSTDHHSTDGLDADLMLALQLQAQEDNLSNNHNGDDAVYYTAVSCAANSSYRPAVYAPDAHRTQEERDRELALLLHNQEMLDDEQRRAREADYAMASRNHALLNQTPSSSQERQRRPTRGAKKGDGCIVS